LQLEWVPDRKPDIRNRPRTWHEQAGERIPVIAVE
jgi:hypothetical protein